MFVRLVALFIMVMFLATSANSATLKNSTIAKDNSPPSQPAAMSFDNYYEWADEFDDQQYIDLSKSWGYEVEGGVAKMMNTYSVWNDPNWQKMRPMTVTNNGGQLDNYALHIVVAYDSEMKSNYGDVRFKHGSNTNFLSYWIENYNSTSADFWVKIPTLPSGQSNMYMFYKNQDATSQSDYYSVFTTWQYQWANDNIVTAKGYTEGCWDPDVSYGNGEFLVAWEEGQPLWLIHGLLGFKQEIRASIYAPDGTMLVHDKEVWGKTTGETTTYYRNENPSIAYGGGKWFVAWQRWQPVADPSDDTLDIKAKLVQRNGEGLTMAPPAGSPPIDVCSASHVQADPKVVFDSYNQHFLVVWEDARDGTSDYEIWGRLYNTDGSPDGSQVQICSDANSQCEPFAAYDSINHQFFIVWEDGITPNYGAFRIRGGIFNHNLGSISTFTVAEPSGYPNNAIDYNFPCVCFDQESQHYLVTWNDDDYHQTPPDIDYWGNVYGKIYSSSGAVIVDTFTIKSGDFVYTEIVPYLAQSFLVTFNNYDYNQNSKIYGKLVASDGSGLGSDIQLSASPAAKADWASIDTDGSSKVCVAWEDIRVVYTPSWADDFPDVFNNIANLNVPSGSTVTYSFGEEKELILEAQITSKVIQPVNLESWHEFQAIFDGNVVFDIMDISGYIVVMDDISPGQNLSTINPNIYPGIRLRATFSRTNPSYTPTLDRWSVLYQGRDEEPPITLASLPDPEPSGWYVESPVIVVLNAIDYPPDTQSGVNVTYYTLNNSEPLIYNKDTGIILVVTESDNWKNHWAINFWSVDNKGNVEDRTKPENYANVKMDVLKPTVVITEPRQEAEVGTKFYVNATASDNDQLDRVEFDIEPFKEYPGLPYNDTTPPYSWLCNVDISRPRANEPITGSDVREIRAQAFDKAGNTFIHQIYITIVYGGSRERTIIYNFKSILERLHLGIVVDKNLNIEMQGLQDIDKVKFTAARIFMGKQTIIWDNDLSDGASASFGVPSGLYKITTTTYREDKMISTALASRVIFIKK